MKMSYYPEIRRFGLAAVVIMALSFAPPPVAAAPFSLTGWIVDSNSKELIKLGNLGRTPPTTTVAAINDSGQVVGQSYTTHPFYPQRAFITGPNGAGMTAIALDGDHSSASDINNSGQVTGLFGTVAGKPALFSRAPMGLNPRS
ncbi:hypothetical protein C8R31_102127 [Nitrosospira sp. Nsp2]|uniref:hypothetical protein n=1 Tax=Nitrosospira sp. Nsp2 TaxID=136548 RepID=UPI000D31072C|nr:hypothetical protein [Nitrosospira sp. Nsp2]PTR16113.1 hypothetical protein C8R31_102127 [Nitrosospira sp. Nsp2]